MPLVTISRGRVVYENGVFMCAEGTGKFCPLRSFPDIAYKKLVQREKVRGQPWPCRGCGCAGAVLWLCQSSAVAVLEQGHGRGCSCGCGCARAVPWLCRGRGCAVPVPRPWLWLWLCWNGAMVWNCAAPCWLLEGTRGQRLCQRRVCARPMPCWGVWQEHRAPENQGVTEDPHLGPCRHTGSARGQLSKRVCYPCHFQACAEHQGSPCPHPDSALGWPSQSSPTAHGGPWCTGTGTRVAKAAQR